MLRLRFLLVLLLALPLAAAGQGAHTVVIDPGHGGEDPGTVWGKIYEKDIVLDVAKTLGEMMREQMPQVRVIHTRTTDVKIPLTKRAQIANDAKANLFVSIHVNALDSKTPPSGAITFVMGQDKADENLGMMATRENDVIFTEEGYETTYKEYLTGSNEMFILYSVLQYANIDKSIRFASVVQKHFKSSTPIPDKGVSRQPFLVLWYATMPGVLVELGFLNNAHDREVLVTAAGKRQMAAAILTAIGDYFEVGKEAGGQIATPAPVPVAKPEPTPAAKPATKPAAKPAPKPTEKQVAKPATQGAFAIQILSTTRKVPKGSSELKGYKPVERYKGGRYRYYVGPYTTRGEAQTALSEVRRSFRDAFITTIE
jgi:N-acetylmuramoyl-L-alanine amidase